MPKASHPAWMNDMGWSTYLQAPPLVDMMIPAPDIRIESKSQSTFQCRRALQLREGWPLPEGMGTYPDSDLVKTRILFLDANEVLIVHTMDGASSPVLTRQPLFNGGIAVGTSPAVLP